MQATYRMASYMQASYMQASYMKASYMQASYMKASYMQEHKRQEHPGARVIFVAAQETDLHLPGGSMVRDSHQSGHP